ncbi:MAG: formate hydrogenlyase [Sulfitobacter sp.]|nr:formate hydrogenlyase [Sulfitobacter sp.]
MNGMLDLFLLLSVPGLPLLLAFPMVRSRVPRPCHVALLPALVVLATQDVTVELNWLFLGAGLGIDGVSRPVLAMSVVLWSAAALPLCAPAGRGGGGTGDGRLSTYLLLTLAGHLGAILATDVVGFLTFSTLMGYGFYALLVAGGDGAARRAGRVYLVCLILADLLLFEAMVIATTTAADPGFEAVRQAMAQSPASGVYLSLVFAGFALKAGVWPLHIWLPLTSRSAPPAAAPLIGGVPVAVGLLGLVRWLPFGAVVSPDLGRMIQGLGVGAMLYAVVVVLLRAPMKTLPVYVAVAATGLFTTAVGVSLANPGAWSLFKVWAPAFIVVLGIGLPLLAVGIQWLEARGRFRAWSARWEGDSIPWFLRWSEAVVRWGSQIGFEVLPRWRALWLGAAGRVWQVRPWQIALDSGERAFRWWRFAITLLLLLGIAAALLIEAF